MSDRIRFGPSGIDESFRGQGLKSSTQMPRWLAGMGLSAYEYSFGRGVNMGEEKARELGAQAAAYDIRMSVHAPYYINLCNPDNDARAKSRQYITQSVEAARWMGASRVVFHTGAVTGRDREEALRLTLDEIENVLRDTGDYSGILLCPETMGKQNQQGTLDEILRICSIDPSRLLPTVDFGHVNALKQGALRSCDDYRRIIDAIGEVLGERAAHSFHIHFSHIEFGKSGEVRHLTFEDTSFGPFFEPLAKVLAERALAPVVICESRDVMAADALRMQTIFEEIRANPPLYNG